jgi:hypothetical protein
MDSTAFAFNKKVTLITSRVVWFFLDNNLMRSQACTDSDPLTTRLCATSIANTIRRPEKQFSSR